MGLVLTIREEAILFIIHTTLLLYSGPQIRTVIHLFWNCFRKLWRDTKYKYIQ